MARLLTLTALLCLLVPASASAWNPSQTCSNGNYVTWPSESTTWKLRDKLSGSNNFYSGLSDNAVINAVEGGWTVWENPSSCGSAWQASYGGTTTATANNSPNELVVEFFETGWPSGFGSVSSTIAVTQNWTQGCNYSHADQYYNGTGFDFTTTNNPGWNDTDLQSITAHENGHWLGLDHTSTQAATMYATYPGGIGARSLHADDQTGVCALYPGSMGPTETSCTNGIDDDGDGAVDCADSDCAGQASCTCVASGALPCGGSVSGSSTNAPSNVDSYSCTNWNNTGPEVVYTVTSPLSGTVTVDMTGLTADLDLFVTTGSGNSCQSTACVDGSGTEGTASEQVSWNATAGTTYFVVADGYQNASGSFTLSATCPAGVPTTETACADGLDDDGDGAVDCADPDCAGNAACQGGSCAGQGTLSCNGSVSGNTAGGPNDVGSWPCVSWETSGPEAVYAFTPSSSGQVTLDLTGLADDVDLFLTTNGGGACDPDGCIGSSGELDTSNEEIVFTATGGTTYYVVIDAWQGATSPFTLSATCTGGGSTTETDCGDGVDDDGDGAIDCDDFDCNGSPECSGDCTNSGECCDVADPGSCVDCELYLVSDNSDPLAICSCLCEGPSDCPSGWDCIEIGSDGDSACWPGANLCLGDDDDDTTAGDDDDDDTGDDDDDASGDDDDDDDDNGGGGGRGSTCACDSTARANPAAVWLIGLLGLVGVTRRRS